MWFTSESLTCISTQCLMCAATVNVTVQLEQNVTLPCYINSSSEMAWYRLSSEKIALLISAARGKLQKKDFITYHNEDQSHFRLEADRGLDSVSLTINGVRESDLGLYYCALGISANTMHFGTAVRLTFADTLLSDITPRSLTKSSFCSLHHDNSHSLRANNLLNLSFPRQYDGSGPKTMILIAGEVSRSGS
uniref:Ig-like domain-containing protein n=1 Tax=Cyprinus carpio carpio TaxID=630221 RepID=A0A9J8DDD9_CYPCA